MNMSFENKISLKLKDAVIALINAVLYLRERERRGGGKKVLLCT